MTSIIDLYQPIHQLVVEEKYEEALSYFKANKSFFDKSSISAQQLLTADILKCLRKTKAYHAALKYLEIYAIEINKTTNDRLFTVWLLIVYDWYKSLFADEQTDLGKSTGKNKPYPDFKELQTVREKLINLLPILAQKTDQFSRDFYSTLIIKVLKTETKQQQPNHQFIVNFCSVIDPAKLSVETKETTIKLKGREKTQDMASVLEDWFAHYTKALYNIGNYEQCISLCQEAFEKIPKMHYSNEIWFSRRLAKCYSQMGELSQAINQFETLTQKKNDWFMLFELSKLYLATQEYTKALDLMHRAMLQSGELSYKVELIEQIGDVYATQDKTILAGEHYSLAASIRQKEGWRIDENLQEKLKKYLLKNEQTTDIAVLLNKLKQVWATSKRQNEQKPTFERLTGLVIRLGMPKEAGVDIWIKATDGKQYYGFVHREDLIYKLIKEKTKLSFQILAQPNKKYDKAVKIKVVNP